MDARAAAWRAALALAALAVMWRIVVVNGVLYDVGGRPHLPQPVATPGIEEPSGQGALTGAIARNPAEVAALLMWAGETRRNNPAAAERAYRAAVDLAPADRDVLNAAAGFMLAQGRVEPAVAMLERLAELYPDTREQVFPLFAGFFFSGEGAAAWSAAVARNPSWMAPFIVASCKSGLDPSVLAALLLKRMVAGLATPPEQACVIERLRVAGRWTEAYHLWLNSLTRSQLAAVGFVFNGGFESAPTPGGFDWMLSQRPERESGHAAEIVRFPGSGTQALRVAYNGKRQNGIPAAQYLAAPPGSYAFTGMARIERMTLGRGVQWTIRCVEQGRNAAVIASSERFMGSSDWQRFAFDVTIPADCAGQILELEPVGPEGSVAFQGGTIWFDELTLRRVP
jgi:tetratricopeptide repeat protein